MTCNLAPPGETTRIHAHRVLAIAPHHDDEVLGCGGLLALLRAAGSAVRVLFLTDSSGGVGSEDAEAGAMRRHDEALRALEVLDVSDVHSLGLADGQLAQHLDEASAGIGRAVLEFRPDLLLCVSPLEVSGDHRAAFAALHRLLTPLRGGTELDEAVTGLRILLYEVNHQGYPDILVDVSAEVERLSAAARAYASQLEQHNYLEAVLGLRRHRTLTLPTEVAAAEGYRELRVADFVTRSLAGLIHYLGGVPELLEVRDGPPVSVVVRTKDRPELLRQALDSLAAQSYRRMEVVLVNDGGVPPDLPDGFPFQLRRIDLPSNRGRAAAANAGVEAASGDYVSFLDDDDLAAPEHIATLAGLVSAADVRVAYADAAVGIYELDPDTGWRLADRRLPYSRDFDPDLLLFDNYIPFNTLIIDRTLFAEAGPFDTELPFFEDWELLIRLAALTRFHHHRQVTCEYRHFRGAGHHIFGERPGERPDFLGMKARVIERHRNRHLPEVLARMVNRLRADIVNQAEVTAAREREAAGLRLSHAELAAAYHCLNGERDSLRGEREQLRAHIQQLDAELQRHRAAVAELSARIQGLFDQEKDLRRAITEQEDHLQKSFAEIERLTGLIRAMEGTRAWRLHRTLERLRGRS